MTNISEKKDVHFGIFLSLPFAISILPFLIKYFDRKLYKKIILGEFGIIENATLVFLIIAIVVGVLVIKDLSGKSKGLNLLKAWIILLSVGCFYFAGEEISWGQHFFGWGTPVSISEINNQGETNLHNINSLFDHIPRITLTILTLIGGVLVPIYKYLTKWEIKESSLLYWLLPTYVCLPTAFLSLTITFPKKIAKLLTGDYPKFLSIHGGEMKECLLALFLMVYICSIFIRLKDLQKGLKQ